MVQGQHPWWIHLTIASQFSEFSQMIWAITFRPTYSIQFNHRGFLFSLSGFGIIGTCEEPSLAHQLAWTEGQLKSLMIVWMSEQVELEFRVACSGPHGLIPSICICCHRGPVLVVPKGRSWEPSSLTPDGIRCTYWTQLNLQLCRLFVYVRMTRGFSWGCIHALCKHELLCAYC